MTEVSDRNGPENFNAATASAWFSFGPDQPRLTVTPDHGFKDDLSDAAKALVPYRCGPFPCAFVLCEIAKWWARTLRGV